LLRLTHYLPISCGDTFHKVVFLPCWESAYFSELTVRLEAAACIMQKLVTAVTED
jgi:hypothetical protein